MSLRARMVIAVMLLVGVAIGTVSTITYVALRAFLVSRVDNQLVATPPDLVDRVCYRSDGDLPPPPPPPTPHRPFLVVRLDSGGEPLGPCVVNLLSRPLRPSPSDNVRVIVDRDRPTLITDDQGVAARALARPSPGGGYQVVAISLDDVDATLNRLLMLELLVGGIALACTGVVGLWAVRWGIRPLSRVTGTARAVAEEVSTGRGGLGRRVPAAPAGTEVGQLAEAFNTMLTAVQTEVAGRQDSEQRMRQFLADASHELRTPLTSLRGYAELIGLRERRDGVQRDPESADALRRMTDEGARMSRLVEDLLTLARSSNTRNGRPCRDEPVAVDELAADAVADIRAAHPDREVSLDARPGAVVRGDRDQLLQVLFNLLTNAAVHTRPGGPIRVRVSTTDTEVRVEVADDGPGLTPRQAAHVFDRFWRADTARTRARGGSGLGLSIVDTLVSGHGGTIDFDTTPEAGTRVTVRLPAAS
ncbi:HAMP domain-containing sensor histidine kinase [Pseudonocardia acaciae]|uniref:HAMP domain-containing sensor histidine kinase n=1 Tax=Pseudonocardia acaciae TaxID=551276 RepID=UPI0006849E80|nr:HAMP domain-containing sensor histidine kinase [Pseudonocardia acaciae]